MKRSLVRLTLAAFVASTALAGAQHAVPRGGGGGGGSSPAGPSGGSSGSSGGDSGSSGSGFSGGDSGSRAVPRHPTTTSSSGGGSSRGGDGAASGRVRSPGGSGGYVDRSSEGAPSTSRPQNGRPTTGYAVPRVTGAVPPGRPGGDYYYYPGSFNWYYNPWGYGAWGLGYIWDPYWFGPGYGGYYGGPIGYGGYGGYSGGYSDSSGYSDSGGYAGDYRRDDQGVGVGELRIKVKPREAKVSVDGAFAGTVDDFDGKFQKMSLVAGTHKVKLEAEGFEPLTFDVLIADGQTVNYKGEMRKR
jgi:PEGA domain